MNKLEELIRQLGYVDDKGKTDISKFSEKMGKKYSTVHKYISGERNVGFKFIHEIKSIFPHFNQNYFSGENEPIFDYPNATMSNAIKSSLRASEVPKMPIYGRVAAGTPLATWTFENKPEDEQDYVQLYTPRLRAYKGELFWFTVDGDSMKPRFHHGDIVATVPIDLKSGQLPREGDIVATFFKSDPDTAAANIKLFQWDVPKKSFILKSINPYSKDHHYEMKQVVKMFRVLCSVNFVDYKQNKN